MSKNEETDDIIDVDDVDENEAPDRDTWTTPRWIANALGEFDLDPCSNERAVIRAKRTFRLDRGQDGLVLAKFVGRSSRVFINCPYSDVMPWVKAYAHTRFCYLLKFDPSTKWCRELLRRTTLVLFPIRRRVAFDPPPGVEGSSNQFPHGLFFAHEEDASDKIRKLCFAWRNLCSTSNP